MQWLDGLTTLRGNLITDRSRQKNRVQSLLVQLLVVPLVKVLFNKKGLAWLRVVTLPTDVRSAVDLYLRLYDDVAAETQKIVDQLIDVTEFAESCHTAKVKSMRTRTAAKKSKY